jgi:DnaJ-domain-containing protein 1
LLRDSGLLFPLPALSTWHKGLSLESARKLLALQPSLLAVGHGHVLSNPQAAMKRAIRVMEQSLAKEESFGERSCASLIVMNDIDFRSRRKVYPERVDEEAAGRKPS